jgi:hypothetical protein
MIVTPPVMALLGASSLAAGVLAASSVFAFRLLRQWDRDSGSERQIALERVTQLVSTVVAFVLVVEAVTLVLFAFNADRMSALFVGAMCAVGTLNASPFGFPTLWAKIAVFFAAGVWLVIDRVDGRGRDYPLIRAKYLGLLALTPLIFAEAGLQLAYFLDLRADTITSCCGKLFGEGKAGAGGDLASLDPKVALILLFGGLAATIGLGLVAPRRRGLLVLHGVASGAMFLVAIAGIVSVISVYVYEQPHHHCPFCLLKREYGHFGFALYLPLFLGTGAGLASGVLALLPPRESLAADMPAIQRRLTRTSATAFAIFAAVALWAVARSGLTLFG